jgi:hypothetical protein
LLFQWKRLHEARIDREVSGNVTALGWVDQLEIVNSTLFEPSATLCFSKATFLQGDTGTGKSVTCEWLTGFVHSDYLARWRKDHHDVKLTYYAPDRQNLRLSVHANEVHRFHGDIPLVNAPGNLNIIYCPEDYERNCRRDEAEDDLLWISHLFKTERNIIRHLCDDIRINGHPFCRNLEPRELRIHNEKGNVDGWFLFVDPLNRGVKGPFGSLSTSETTAVLVQFATALARLQVKRAPTLLLVVSVKFSKFDPDSR